MKLSFQWNLLSLNFFDLWKPTLIVASPPWTLIWMPKGHCRIFSSLHQCLKPTIWQAIWNSSPYEEREGNHWLCLGSWTSMSKWCYYSMHDWIDSFGEHEIFESRWTLCSKKNIYVISINKDCIGKNRLEWPKIWSSFWIQKLLMDLLAKSHCMNGQIICPKFLWDWPITRCTLGNEIQRPDSNIFEVLARFECSMQWFSFHSKVPAMPEVAPPHRPKIPALCDVEPQKKMAILLILMTKNQSIAMM